MCNEKKNMKKFSSLLIILLLITSICNSQNKLGLFEFGDTLFEIGDIHKIEIRYSVGRVTLMEPLQVLDSVTEFMNLNPNIVLEVSSHTDYRGSENANFEVSQRRAEAVCEYLIFKGIKPLRLQFVGYGESKPITVTCNVCAKYKFLIEGQVLYREFIEKLDLVEEQEIAHSLNRRTILRIINK